MSNATIETGRGQNACSLSLSHRWDMRRERRRRQRRKSKTREELIVVDGTNLLVVKCLGGGRKDDITKTRKEGKEKEKRVWVGEQSKEHEVSTSPTSGQAINITNIRASNQHHQHQGKQSKKTSKVRKQTLNKRSPIKPGSGKYLCVHRVSQTKTTTTTTTTTKTKTSSWLSSQRKKSSMGCLHDKQQAVLLQQGVEPMGTKYNYMTKQNSFRTQF